MTTPQNSRRRHPPSIAVSHNSTSFVIRVAVVPTASDGPALDHVDLSAAGAGPTRRLGQVSAVGDDVVRAKTPLHRLSSKLVCVTELRKANLRRVIN